MRSDVEDRVRWLLGQEPTRSMTAGRLREKLVEHMGDVVASGEQLARDLASSAGFVVLDAPPAAHEILAVEPWSARYESALRAAFEGRDVRVVLNDGSAGPTADAATTFTLVADSVLQLSAAAANDAVLRQELNAALTAAEECERAVSRLMTEPQAAPDRSTTPLRGPPPRE